MNLIRWSPFGEISLLQNEMNRLFDSALHGWPAETSNAAINWSPAADVYESASELVVHVDLPGVDPKNGGCARRKQRFEHSRRTSF
jgi:HSP20 family protein